jgi:hypothetical protein
LFVCLFLYNNYYLCYLQLSARAPSACSDPRTLSKSLKMAFRSAAMIVLISGTVAEVDHYLVDGSQVAYEFDGHGGLSAGGRFVNEREGRRWGGDGRNISTISTRTHTFTHSHSHHSPVFTRWSLRAPLSSPLTLIASRNVFFNYFLVSNTSSHTEPLFSMLIWLYQAFVEPVAPARDYSSTTRNRSGPRCSTTCSSQGLGPRSA